MTNLQVLSIRDKLMKNIWEMDMDTAMIIMTTGMDTVMIMDTDTATISMIMGAGTVMIMKIQMQEWKHAPETPV